MSKTTGLCISCQTLDALPCCNETEPDGIPCAGTMRWGWPEYVCGTCGGRCGALVHPTHKEVIPTRTEEVHP